MRDKIKIKLKVLCVKYCGLKRWDITVIVRPVAVFMGKTDSGQNAVSEN
jgi:hypothetical protein